LVEEVQKADGTAMAIPGDLGDGSAAVYVVRRVLESLGTLDILVNNAAIGSAADRSPVVAFDDAFWHNPLALNLPLPTFSRRLCFCDNAYAEFHPMLKDPRWTQWRCLRRSDSTQPKRNRA
jgi:NAD(P)-dependent dehydrogenase (short-subunit alcohol dehydrogenase family)